MHCNWSGQCWWKHLVTLFLEKPFNGQLLFTLPLGLFNAVEYPCKNLPSFNINLRGWECHHWASAAQTEPSKTTMTSISLQLCPNGPRPSQESADCLLTLFSCGIFVLIFVLVRSPQPSKILKSQSNTLFAGEVLLLQHVIKMQNTLLQVIVSEYFNQNVWGFL